jgi:hypothetical protein
LNREKKRNETRDKRERELKFVGEPTDRPTDREERRRRRKKKKEKWRDDDDNDDP